MFVRKGWDVYVRTPLSAAEPAGPCLKSSPASPCSLLKNTGQLPFWRTRRWEPGTGKAAGVCRESVSLHLYGDLLKEIVPRWLTTNDAIMRSYFD